MLFSLNGTLNTLPPLELAPMLTFLPVAQSLPLSQTFSPPVNIQLLPQTIALSHRLQARLYTVLGAEGLAFQALGVIIKLECWRVPRWSGWKHKGKGDGAAQPSLLWAIW